jgi:hypothetical protein
VDKDTRVSGVLSAGESSLLSYIYRGGNEHTTREEEREHRNTHRGSWHLEGI